MRHARLLALLPALLALGCLGDWAEPLGSVRGGRIDARLVGQWKCQKVSQATKLGLSIIPFDQDQYVMALAADGDEKKETIYFRGHTTTVSGHDVMNLKELEDEPKSGGWHYARFHFPQDGQLWIDPIRREPLQDVPDDVESRRQAVGDLFEAPELWEAGYRCMPFKDEPVTR